jgi:uncharacterized iron-regulated protein
MRAFLWLCVTPIMFLVLAGCTAPRPVAHAPPNPRGLPVFTGDGNPATWESIVAAAAGADAVIIGENHGHAAGLASAAALFEDVLARAHATALSLEFFERDEQSRIDDYLAGLADEQTFRRRTARTDSNYPLGHRAMLEAAKAARRPVIAANAPRAYVSLARRESFERLATLTTEQRRLVRVPDAMPEGRYRDDFVKLMTESLAGSHGPGTGAPSDAASRQKMVEAMLRSQSVWDWTMADSIARALDAANTPVVHVVGRFHSDFQGGLVQALRRIRPGTRVMTVSYVDAASTSLRPEDRARADFVFYAGP